MGKEFEEGKSNELKFVMSMDKLEPLLQNTSNNGGTREEFGVKYKTVHDMEIATSLPSTFKSEYFTLVGQQFFIFHTTTGSLLSFSKLIVTSLRSIVFS